MAEVLQELIGGQQFSYGCNTSTGSRRFLLYEDDTSVSFPLGRALNYLKQNLDIGMGWEGVPGWTVTDVTVQSSSERSEAYEITANYRFGVACDTAPWMIGCVSTNVSARTEMLDMYRANPKTIAQVAPREDGNEGTDIGGNSMDVGGEAASYLLPLLDLQVVENATSPPNHIVLASYIGCRNKFQWGNGAPPGSLVYRGTSSNLNGGIYTLTHNFTLDLDLHHARQVAVNNADGEAMVASANIATQTGDGKNAIIAKGCSEHVVWVQPFDCLLDFDLIPFSDCWPTSPYSNLDHMWPNGMSTPASIYG
tara:strand:- start:12766 stop:13692 length:927 start_codon:yes stop_codon:yes gene_type:complete